METTGCGSVDNGVNIAVGVLEGNGVNIVVEVLEGNAEAFSARRILYNRRESNREKGESDIAPLFRRFADYVPKEIERNEGTTDVVLREGESVSAGTKARL